jgi:putative transposase
VMPEHIHVLISEPKRNTVPKVVQVLKQRVARRLLRKRQPSAQRELWERSRRRFWQRRYYDFNVYSDRKVTEKLRYMHRNPVQRGLVAAPELWALEQLPSIRSLRGRNSEAELAAAFR